MYRLLKFFFFSKTISVLLYEAELYYKNNPLDSSDHAVTNILSISEIRAYRQHICHLIILPIKIIPYRVTRQ